MNYTRTVRYYRRQLIMKKVRAYLYRILAVVLLIALCCHPYRPLITGKIYQAAGKLFRYTLNLVNHPAVIINQAMPAVSWTTLENEKPVDGESLFAAADNLVAWKGNWAKKILAGQIPLLKEIPPLAETPVNTKPPEKTEKSSTPATATVLTGPPLVAIYNTHTGETYALTDGVERLNGKRGAVVKVAAELQKQLEQKHGIKVVRSDTIHDQNYNTSYIESEKTVQTLIKEHQELKFIFDVHRDAERPRKDCIVEINGRTAAKVLIVVGSDARMPFPNWQKNLANARMLTDKMDEMYPGLSLGVRVKEGRYNQHYHTGALLIEVGAVANSTEEALYTAKLLGDVIAACIKESSSTS